MLLCSLQKEHSVTERKDSQIKALPTFAVEDMWYEIISVFWRGHEIIELNKVKKLSLGGFDSRLVEVGRLIFSHQYALNTLPPKVGGGIMPLMFLS